MPMDADTIAVLRKTWDQAIEQGDQFPGFFYGYLHLAHAETRPMFPAGMAQQRDRLVNAIGEVIANIDQLDRAVPILQRLGRDHARRYGVRPEHYPMVAEALMATFEHYLGADWTPQAAGAWSAAYQLVADVMIAAAERPFAKELADGNH
jgi:hemoglobin-like flavoprotein